MVADDDSVIPFVYTCGPQDMTLLRASDYCFIIERPEDEDVEISPLPMTELTELSEDQLTGASGSRNRAPPRRKGSFAMFSRPHSESKSKLSSAPSGDGVHTEEEKHSIDVSQPGPFALTDTAAATPTAGTPKATGTAL